MNNKSTRLRTDAQLNRLSQWKYALLLLMLLTLLFQAIPTFYGDIPALGVHAKNQENITVSRVKNALSAQGLSALDVSVHSKTQGETTDKTIVATFKDVESQQRAKQILGQNFGKNADITVQYQSAAPPWFSAFGADPVKLGLDLRGGVQLLLFVDLEAVYDNMSETMVSTLQTALREQKLRGVIVRQVSPTSIALKGALSALPGFLDDFLQPFANQWEVKKEGGGYILSMMESELLELNKSAMAQNISILRNRIGELGIVEASVVRQGRDHIRVELPGVHDPKQAKSVIGATASLAFYEVSLTGMNKIQGKDGEVVRLARFPVLSGEHIIDARSGNDEMGRPQVDIRLNGFGGDKMTQFSRRNIGQPMATVYTEYSLDEKGKLQPQDEVINVATIQSVLGNSFRITGLDSTQEALELSMLLRSGALTAPIHIVEERAIGPTLGAKNIQAGFSALALGMLGMAVFMILWYRRFGWVAIVALGANLIMQIGLLVMLPGAVLTLPGIAGLVLTVGMAVDTNVLIFERIRDRLREGASLATSIDFGYRSAFFTIFDANITTLISALCLYGIGSGPLQGFATTLILGLITSMICGIWGTRAIINPIWGRDTRRAVKI